MTARPIVSPADRAPTKRHAAGPDVPAALIAVALFVAAVVLPKAVFDPVDLPETEDWRGNSASLPTD